MLTRVINPSKTQLICVSDDRNSDINSYIIAGGKRIDSVKEMKILGFIFENKPSVEAHVMYCVNKFNRAIWALNHLKRANIDIRTLLEVYKVMLRPLLEYCSAICHPMITKTMSYELEKQQKRALKTIYGFDKEYEELLSMTGIKTLEKRREEAFANFTRKLVSSERFGVLFPEKEAHGMELRKTKTYCEEFARTNRLYNSPIYSMRRFLNEDMNI